MMIPDKEKAIMSKFMQDFWLFIKTNWFVEDKDEEWERLVIQSNQLANKYKDEEEKKIPPAIVQLIVGYLCYLECEGCGKKRDYVTRPTPPSAFEQYMRKKGLI